MAHESVLLVDDEEEFTRILAERIKARGARVDTAADGIEALDKAKNTTYDAIILDLAMPKMDGLETLEHLLELNPNLQVILLTGHATVQTGVEAMKLGAVDVLEKPAQFQDLMEKIHKAGAKKMLLVEKRSEEEIKRILQTKAW